MRGRRLTTKAGRASPLPFLSQLRRPGVRRKGGRSWRVSCTCCASNAH